MLAQTAPVGTPTSKRDEEQQKRDEELKKLGTLAPNFARGLEPLASGTNLFLSGLTRQGTASDTNLLTPSDIRPSTGLDRSPDRPLPEINERPFTVAAPHAQEKVRRTAQGLQGSCKSLLRDHLRKRYGLSKVAPERIKFKDKQDLSVEDLRRILTSAHPTVEHCVSDAIQYLSQIHYVSSDAAEILSWARAYLELCVVAMELDDPRKGYLLAESALRIMDPMLRELVDPAIRDEDISPGYRCALTETACMCYCNAALCIEAEQGKRGAPQITKYLEKGLQLAVTMLADGHPLIELLDDCSVDAGKKYGRQRLIADMALFTFEREETARKKKLMNDLSYGAPMNMSLPDLVAVTRHMEKHSGSTFTGGVQPIREIIDKPPPSPKRKSKDRNKQSQAASSQQKPSNPFLFFEDNELVQQEKRKWLYPNPEYVAHRVVDFKFKKKIMKQFQDMKTNDELYDMALFHQSFARVLTAVKAKKAKEEQFRRDALKGLHKLKTGAGHERLLEVIGDADEAAADVFGDVAKKALAMGAAMQKMGKRAEEAKDVVNIFSQSAC
jgi:hypothetical protein